MKALVIGLGNMGRALAMGVLARLAKDELEIIGYDNDRERARSLEASLGLPVVTHSDEALAAADVLILCIKPQGLASLAKTMAGKIKDSAVIISILAGITTEDLQDILQFDGPIIRGMPNIAATVGCAASVLCHNAACSKQHLDLAEKIFTSVGEAYWAKEALMDAVTGLSGSGPAYLCMVIESLTDGGVKMGLSRPLALKLATQTVAGAAELVKKTGLHPAVLRDQVTTPGGTTIHAIHELETHGLRSMLISAVVTATEKSTDLRLNRLR